MSKVIKLNITKKVRYIFDKETEENAQLGEKVIDHFGSFIDNSWEMSDLDRFNKVLRDCGLTVEGFLSEEWVPPTTKKKLPVKKPPTVKKKPTEKEIVVDEKVPAKKKVVRKNAFSKKAPVKKQVRKKK